MKSRFRIDKLLTLTSDLSLGCKLDFRLFTSVSSLAKQADSALCANNSWVCSIFDARFIIFQLVESPLFCWIPLAFNEKIANGYWCKTRIVERWLKFLQTWVGVSLSGANDSSCVLNDKTTPNFCCVEKILELGPCHLFPPKLRRGGIRQKVQIPLCRHRLRWNFGPIK